MCRAREVQKAEIQLQWCGKSSSRNRDQLNTRNAEDRPKHPTDDCCASSNTTYCQIFGTSTAHFIRRISRTKSCGAALVITRITAGSTTLNDQRTCQNILEGQLRSKIFVHAMYPLPLEDHISCNGDLDKAWKSANTRKT